MIFILNNKQETIGVASNSNPLSLPYFNDEHIESLTGVHSYSFEVPITHEDSALLETEGHVIIKNLDGEHLLFTIKEISDARDNGKLIKKVYCEETAISELLSDVVRPKLMNSTTLENAVKSVVTNSMGWTVGDMAYTESQDVEFTDYMTVLEALRKLVEQYNKEMYFTVTLKGTKIDKKQINIVDQRGNDTRIRFDYSYDLRGVTRSEDSSKVVTALVAVGKGNTDKERINLSSLPAFVEGDFYKENGSDWIGSDSALQQFGLNGRHRFGIFIDSNADTPEALKRSALREIKDRIVPAVHYSTGVTNLERITGYEAKRVRLGDTVVINDKSFEPYIVIEGRVNEITRSYTDSSSDKVSLGNYKPITLSTNKAIQDLQNIISLNEDKWNEVPDINVDEINDKLTEIDDRTNPATIIGTVIYSEDFTSIFDKKANVEDLSGLATGEELSEIKGEVLQYVDGRIDGEGGINEEINKVTSALEKTANEINAKFTSSGGINLVKNSIGFAGTDLWEVNGTVRTIQNSEMEQLGFGSGFISEYGEKGSITQTINTSKGSDYSISFWVKKTRDNPTEADATVEIWENGVKKYIIGRVSNTGTTNGFELALHTFSTEYSEITVKVNFGEYCEAVISGLMVNVGTIPFQWQHADGEVYNTNIQMNLNGIKVLSSNYRGYTIMSPQEFSGYAEVLNDNDEPVMTRVFTLNNDVTEVSKLDADHEINMSTMKVIPFHNASNKGWAFISND